MVESTEELRPSVIRQIAQWWQQILTDVEAEGEPLAEADFSEVMREFDCSEEEALRGVGVGEQLHWGAVRETSS